MNKLEDFFFNHKKKLVLNKWHHYLKIYDRHFSKFIGKNPVILEIGVENGGSLDMWNHYFDNKCTIYGVDINPKCLEVPKILEASNITVTIGHQESREFWRDFLKDKPKFDIVIDDGGHRMEQQIITYQEIYDHILDDGVYLCEDLHTSYWKGWGNECNPTFIEYSKNFIDMINSHHFQEDNKNFHNIDYENFRKTTNSIHYYDSVLVLEKSVNPPPTESVR